MANQQGKYLANVFANNYVTGNPATAKMDNLESFKYNHKVCLVLDQVCLISHSALYTFIHIHIYTYVHV